LPSSVRVLLWLVAAAWVLFGLSWFVLHGWIVPRIGEFRPRLEIEASKALGVPVRIGEITAHVPGHDPLLRAARRHPARPQGREALRLPRVLGALSPSSIWGLGFEQIYIDKPELDIRRAATEKSTSAGWTSRRTARPARARRPTGFFADRIRHARRHRALDRRIAEARRRWR
jgi:uncharacterized protein YhdP